MDKITTIEQAKQLGLKTHQLNNIDWCYQDENGNLRLFRDGKELTEGIVAKMVISHKNGNWSYKDKQDIWHDFDKHGNKIGE